MASKRSIEYHQQWIGFLNPTGLVFSPHALDDAQVVINESVISEQKDLYALVTKTIDDNVEFTGFENVLDIFYKILNWRESDLISDQEFISKYSFSHPQFGEMISPDYIAKVGDDKLILIQKMSHDDFDKSSLSEDDWNSSPHFKFERLLRETQVPTGILVSGKKLRLIFAPRGESSGYIDFPFHLMYQPSGRLVFSAFRELLSDAKIFNSQKGQSLIEILELSRKYQAQVSIELSGQVLAALYELLRGFQAANDDESGKLLEKTLAENPQLIYEGLLTTLLRMVFIMYAEDRNLLATDEIYQSSYSLAGLYERLRQDEAQNPDTMDSRYGAWAYLISLFRLIYDGAEYESKKGKVILPARHGHLFDPDIYLFLEGRQSKDHPYNKAPKISDGVIFRVLTNLLVLNGERISYRTLDVEQIGSVYETMMGFELGLAEGETIALKPAKAHGAPIPINLTEILKVKDKAKKLNEVSDVKLTNKVKKEFNECKTIEELEKVLEKKIDIRATPFRLSKGAMVLVPSEARRKSGSHYTPRELTEPIVRVALEPIFKNLGEKPTPEQILDLKICDPAMGSGAFLVEACRQLSEKLVESWATHKVNMAISADEDELLHARRLIAQKCLYGVDKNHMAVNLAKLSLWLVTLSKDHSFSFLDHNLKHGDSLIGLTNKQIMAFDYTDRDDLTLFQYVKDQLVEALEAREEIIHASDEQNYEALKEIELEYLMRLEPLRLVGNLALKCFFDGAKEKERVGNLQEHSLKISNYLAANDFARLEEYCHKQLGDFSCKFVPFHWELEFPEVFQRKNKGFDSIIGNPPFLGGRKISGALGAQYIIWLSHTYPPAGNLCDLVAYFLRSSFLKINSCGTLVVITTKTISQGDTRTGGLLPIIKNDGSIYNVQSKIRWPGVAAVIVSTVGILRSDNFKIQKKLNGRPVQYISSFFNEAKIEEHPHSLLVMKELHSTGSKIYGQGFLFDDEDDAATPLLVKDKILSSNPDLEGRIRPYIGGQEVNSQAIPSPMRFAINLSDLNENQLVEYPELLDIVLKKVKPERDALPDSTSSNKQLKKKWWAYQAHRPNFYRKIHSLNRVLVLSQVTAHLSFTFLPSDWIYSQKLNLFAMDRFSHFAILQSKIHEVWALFFTSSLGETINYSSSDCFENFPFPQEVNEGLDAIGKEYYDYRQALMVNRNEGLTKIYNRFNDPNQNNADLEGFRALQKKMDECVFASYGWRDLRAQYEFISEEIEEEGLDTTSAGDYKYKFKSDLQDEILARLLQLNQSRYEEEVRLGLHKR
jgi:hypothetical protein